MPGHLDRVSNFMNDEYFPPVHVEIGLHDINSFWGDFFFPYSMRTKRHNIVH